jgi:6-pyruvoyl-tetrahydropterin synthase
MFQVSVEETFSAGHALRGYKGKCENVHGHNYRVRVTLEGPEFDRVAGGFYAVEADCSGDYGQVGPPVCE